MELYAEDDRGEVSQGYFEPAAAETVSVIMLNTS